MYPEGVAVSNLTFCKDWGWGRHGEGEAGLRYGKYTFLFHFNSWYGDIGVKKSSCRILKRNIAWKSRHIFSPLLFALFPHLYHSFCLPLREKRRKSDIGEKRTAPFRSSGQGRRLFHHANETRHGRLRTRRRDVTSASNFPPRLWFSFVMTGDSVPSLVGPDCFPARNCGF